MTRDESPSSFQIAKTHKKMPETAAALRVLCLHGFRQNALLMNKATGALRKQLKSKRVEFGT